ncbi:hypothetical protein [Erythrobacter sp. WG]|uniref:hypothetical protein n=1 Tax=Erythrobacter sp. WG TaxID=2985510 RepID=UPI003B634051
MQYREEDGWRDFSPSNLLNGFVDLGFDGARGGVHVKFVGADTDLTGNGVAPSNCSPSGAARYSPGRTTSATGMAG